MPTVFVPLDRVQDSPYQPRRHYDPAAIEALADSIARDGQLQTPVGRMVNSAGSPCVPDHVGFCVENGHTFKPQDADAVVLDHIDASVQLAYGHRRARAWRLLWERHRDTAPEFRPTGMDGVPVDAMPVELEPLTDEQMFARGVTENRQREGISAVEEAEAMQAAIESFGWTHEVIGERFGYTRATVSNKLRLLKLPEAVREIVVEGLLPERTARALVAMFDLDERLAPFAMHRDVQDRRLGDLEIRMKLEGGETHEGFAAYVRRYVQQVEALADAAERERAPGLDFGDDTPEADSVEAEDLGSVGAWVSIRQNGSFASAERTRVELPSQGAFEVDGMTYHVVPSVSRLHADGTPDIDLGHGRDQFDVIDPDGEIVCRYSKTVAAAEREARSRIRHAAKPVATEDDGYDDGGARLGQIAETMGVQPKAPATPPPTSEPDANLHEPPFGTDEDGEPLTEAEADARYEDMDAQQQALVVAEWGALSDALHQLGESLPKPAWRVVAKLLGDREMQRSADGDWSFPFAAGFARSLVERMSDAYGDSQAREAAEAWGVTVEWPEADVSADTPEAVSVDSDVNWQDAVLSDLDPEARATDAYGFSGTRPSEAADPVAATRAALEADEDPHLIRRDLEAGLQSVLKEIPNPTTGTRNMAFRQALAFVQEHLGEPVGPVGTDGEWIKTGPEPADDVPEAGEIVPTEAASVPNPGPGEPTDGDAVPDPAPDVPDPEAPEPYSVRALAFEGVATVKSQLGDGVAEVGVERFLSAFGHTWAVVPRLGGRSHGGSIPDDSPIRWNVLLVETGVGLNISAETPEEAETQARARMAEQGAEQIAKVVEFSRARYGTVNPVSGDGAATETAPEVAGADV